MSRFSGSLKTAVAVGLCMSGLMTAQGGEIARIVSRPLSASEIKSAGGLATTTNLKSSGLDVIAVGTPAYLEVIVTNKSFYNVADYATYTNTTTVDTKTTTNVTWSVVSKPSQSTTPLAALLTNSPLTNLVTTPIYDVGQRNACYVPTNVVDGQLVGRSVLLPDVEGQYVIAATVAGIHVTTNAGGTLSTNSRSISVTNTITVGTWMGVEGSACEYCHSDHGIAVNDNVDGWASGNEDDGMAHWDAFTRKVDGGPDYHSTFKESCYGCHTLGYEQGPVIGGVTNPAFANNGGFDDIMRLYPSWIPPTNNGTGVAATNWAVMPLALQNKANIQCENCHGPASQHNGVSNKIDISISAGVCGYCHDSTNGHPIVFEWKQSLHATGYVFSAEAVCYNCHSGRGFIDEFDGDGKMTRATTNEGIACAACHDVHPDPITGNANMLRTLEDVKLGNFTNILNNVPGSTVATITTGGKGKLCMKCHKSRQDAEVYVRTTAGSSRFGPHHGPQADMLAGANAVEYGGVSIVGVENPHLSVPDTCVHCHMQSLTTDVNATYSNSWMFTGGHTMHMTTTGGVDVVRACAICHYTDYFGDAVTNFNFTFRAGDYDTNGIIEGVETEIDNLASNLAMLLPPIGSNLVTISSSYTTNQLKAAFNYMFVTEDKSHGIHNAKYAAAILQASIADLQVSYTARGTVQFTAGAGSVAENGGSVTVTVTRTGGSYGAATVAYATANGSAASGTDYTAASGTLSWTNGESAAKTIAVPILNDATYEGNETFTVTLSGPTGVSLGSPASVTVTIVDDEQRPITHGLIMQLPTGELAAWMMSTNRVILSTNNIYPYPMTWQVRDVGDIDGDGVPDLISQLATGESACWYMATNWTVDSTVNIYWSRTKLQVVGVGDVDRDGVADLIVQSRAAGVACWFMNANATIKSTMTITNRTLSTVGGAGDVDGDGTADLIVQSSTAAECWFLNANGTIKSKTTFYATLAPYTISAVGDINGDGVADVILQNLTAGTIGAWFMNADGSIKANSWAYIQGSASSWKVRGLSVGH